MFGAWANLGILFLGLIVAGLAWFVLYVLGNMIFDTMIQAPANKIRKLRESRDKDHYIY